MNCEYLHAYAHRNDIFVVVAALVDKIGMLIGKLSIVVADMMNLVVAAVFVVLAVAVVAAAIVGSPV